MKKIFVLSAIRKTTFPGKHKKISVSLPVLGLTQIKMETVTALWTVTMATLLVSTGVYLAKLMDVSLVS